MNAHTVSNAQKCSDDLRQYCLQVRQFEAYGEPCIDEAICTTKEELLHIKVNLRVT